MLLYPLIALCDDHFEQLNKLGLLNDWTIERSKIENGIIIICEDYTNYYQCEKTATRRFHLEVLPEQLAARRLGSKGGSIRSEKKADAVRLNGSKGGRPASLYFYVLDNTQGSLKLKGQVYWNEITTQAICNSTRTAQTAFGGRPVEQLEAALTILNDSLQSYKIFPYTARGARQFLKETPNGSKCIARQLIPAEHMKGHKIDNESHPADIAFSESC